MDKLKETLALLVHMQVIYKRFMPHPTYAHYTYLDITITEMKSYQIPIEKNWKNYKGDEELPNSYREELERH